MKLNKKRIINIIIMIISIPVIFAQEAWNITFDWMFDPEDAEG